MLRLSASCIAMFLIASATIALGDARPFTYNSDTYAIGKGKFEYEQWVTWKIHTPDEHGFNSYEIRHEFEYGLADNIDVALYLPNWSYEDSKEFTGTRFDSVGLEAVFYLSNPVTDAVGLGIYNELSIGESSVEYELKLLVQKDIDKWIFSYNLVLETAIDGMFDSTAENEVEGELKNIFGVSYAITPGILVGAEAVIESVYVDWSVYEKTQAFVGPVVSWQGHEHFWITGTGLFQVTDEDGEPDFQLRLIAGWTF